MPALATSSGLSVRPSGSGAPLSSAAAGAAAAGGPWRQAASAISAAHAAVASSVHRMSGRGMRLTGAAVRGHWLLGRLPSAAERLAERDQRSQPRQPELNGLVAGIVKNALRLEQRQQVPRAMFVTQPCALEGAL